MTPSLEDVRKSMRGDELSVTLEAKDGFPFYARDVAKLVGSMDRLLVAIGKGLSPETPLVTTVTRVDVLPPKLRVTFRLVPKPPRTRRPR